MKQLLSELRIALIATISLALILCAFYPLGIWAVAQGLWPNQANGSLLQRNGRLVGSRLIGQEFHAPHYFHPRPSAAGAGYDGSSSSGSNLGPLSQKLIDTVRQRVLDYRIENNLESNILIPADAVTASASGLDPHISLKNAQLQARRVAVARHLKEETLLKQIAIHTRGRDLMIFGEPRVNVFELNMVLDTLLEYDDK